MSATVTPMGQMSGGGQMCYVPSLIFAVHCATRRERELVNHSSTVIADQSSVPLRSHAETACQRYLNASVTRQPAGLAFV